MYDIQYFNFDSGLFLTPSAQEISKLIQAKAKNNHPFYKIFHKIDSQKAITPYLSIAKGIREQFSDLIVISMGGAMLNPSAVLSLTNYKKTGPNIHFLNTTDPYYFQKLINKVELDKTGILIISNSGNTLETVSLCSAIINQFNNQGITDLSKRLFFITNKNQGVLQDIAKRFNAKIIEHETSISGRYSGLSNVVIIPGLISGLDINEYIEGANIILDAFYKEQENNISVQSAIALYNLNKPITVNLGYLQRFYMYLHWYSQIIAESLGKNKKGYTPIYGLGPQDQHSMLQLYLEGPRDKIFSLFYVNKISNKNNEIKTATIKETDYISNKSIAEINLANFNATLNAIKKSELPVRSLILKDLSAKTVGALMCHSMIEVVVLGHLMQINPFDQPGVELIKAEAKKLCIIKNEL